MATNDSIPTAATMFGPKRKIRKRPLDLTPQLSFDLPPAPVYSPIVLTPKPPLAQPPPPPRPALYKISQLIAEIRQLVEGAYLTNVHVEGEISNCRPAASGHVYFTLKDGDAQLPVVLFRRQAQLLGFKPKDGLAVEVKGRVAVYETRGQVQLIAETLRPRGTGALQLAFEHLRDKLRREGLFDRSRRPLPPFPHCVGIVTSAHGAALRDIINIVRRRHARLNLLIYPAAMQGPNCARQVTNGIRWFNQQVQNRVPHPREARVGPDQHPNLPCVDIILITRGGGSFEDLNGFNDETLARTIAASHLPVVAAIGHEIDHTIAEYVADLRAPTPSAAAELITAAQHRVEERVWSLEKRIHQAGELHLLRARRRLERLSAAQVLARLRDGISLRQQKIDELRFRLQAARDRRARTMAARLAALEARLRRQDPAVRLAGARHRHTALAARLTRVSAELTTRPRRRLETARLHLEALSPLAVLSRGYALVFTEQGTILKFATDATPGDTLTTRLAQGTLRSQVLPTT